VRQELAGATVLLTGATGYVGSLVLEQLLRTTDVRKAYVLMRGRRGASPAQRLEALLAGPLFHLLRGRPALAAKVVAIEGDMDAPGLGINLEDRAALTREVEVLVHCAADIRLEVDVQTTLRANYEGTRRLLELAAEASPARGGRLRAHVHVSSAFVNMNRPRGSSVSERIYPMRHGAASAAGGGGGAAAAEGGSERGGGGEGGSGSFFSPGNNNGSNNNGNNNNGNNNNGAAAASPGGEELDCEAVVAELMALPPPAAEARAEVLCALWGYANNYVLGKHLAEQLVARRHREGLLPPLGTAIVRPSLVAAVARAPHPGYCGNFAGPIGGVAAMVTGLYGPLDGIASRPLGVWDIIPGDVVATVVLAAAAAASAGAAGLVARAARAAREGRCDSVAEALAAQASGALSSTGGSAAGGSGAPRCRSLAARLQLSADESAALDASTTPASSPSTGSARPDSPTEPHQQQQQQQQGPASPQPGAPTPPPPPPPALSALAAAAPALGRDADAAPSEPPARAEPPRARDLLIVHACTSSTYPVTLMEAWNAAAEFITAHPPPFSLRGSRSVIPRMPPTFEPSPERVRRTDRRTGAKVAAVCNLLRLVGDRRGAAKLRAGFASIVVQNNGRTDRSLTFETHGLLALEAALAPAERPQRMMVWRPGPAPADALALSEAYLSAPLEAGAAAPAPAPVVAPADLPPVSWRAFLLTQAAGVYGTMFRRAVPREADAAAELRRRQKAAWWRRPLGVAGEPETWSAKRIGPGQAVVEGSWSAAASMSRIEHDYVLVKPLKTAAAA